MKIAEMETIKNNMVYRTITTKVKKIVHYVNKEKIEK